MQRVSKVDNVILHCEDNDVIAITVFNGRAVLGKFREMTRKEQEEFYGVHQIK